MKNDGEDHGEERILERIICTIIGMVLWHNATKHLTFDGEEEESPCVQHKKQMIHATNDSSPGFETKTRYGGQVRHPFFEEGVRSLNNEFVSKVMNCIRTHHHHDGGPFQ